jgi:predicted permease
LISGRFFADTDDPTSQDVVIVDEAAVRQFWPHEDPIGRRVGFTFGVPKPRWFTVVGVVGNIRQNGLDSAATPHLFFSFFQLTSRTLSVTARMNGSSGDDPAKMSQVGEQIKREIQAVDPDLPVFGIEPMSDLVSASVSRRRFSAEVIGTFSMLALLLAAIGVYGVIAFWVAQRTREIGIRMALGAQREDVLRLVLGRGMRLALAGVAAGLLAAVCAGPLLRSQLYGISIVDPLVFATVPAVLLLVALFAGYVPALRAMRVDPVVALRYE